MPNIIEKSKPTPIKQKPSPAFKTFPKEIKYTNNEEFTNIDKVRSRIRKNEIDHLHFEPVIGTADGQVLFKNVYNTTYRNEELKKKGQHEK